MYHYVVIRAFDAYKVGDRITEQSAIAAALATNAANLARVFAVTPEAAQRR